MAAKRARFEQLAMPAVNALYRQAMRLTNDPDDAQDLVQDTFERGFKAFDSFQPGSNFEAWMTTIAQCLLQPVCQGQAAPAACQRLHR